MATLVTADSPLPGLQPGRAAPVPARSRCSSATGARRALMSPMLRLSDTSLRRAGLRRCTPQTSSGVRSSRSAPSAGKGKTYE